ASGSPLIHLDHQHTRNLVFSDAVSIPNVSTHVDFSKGQRDTEATLVSTFHGSLGLMGSSSNKKSGDGADTNTMVIDDVDDISFDESVLNYESDDVARKMDSGVGNIGGYRKGKRKGFPAKNLMAERRRRKKMNDLCERYGQLQRKWGKKTLTRPNPIPVTTTNKHVLMDVQRQPRWPLQESFSGKMAHVELEMSTSKLRLKNVVTYDHYGESDDDIEYGGGYIGEYGYVDDDSDFPVMEQYHEMLRIPGQYTQHNFMMDEAISVAVIIDKLPPSSKEFKHGLRNQELDNNPKGKNQIGSSSVNMVEGDGAKNSKNNKIKRKFKSGDDKFVNKKVIVTCWKCKKTGHMKKDCRSRKGNDGAGSNGSKDPEKQQGHNFDFMHNFVNVLHYVSVISDAFYIQDDEVAWWVDSGATSHVCKDLR
ncbi:zinc finger, CCHC-type containing protein, partial [Tanacetum coccineum]